MILIKMAIFLVTDLITLTISEPRDAGGIFSKILVILCIFLQDFQTFNSCLSGQGVSPLVVGAT